MMLAASAHGSGERVGEGSDEGPRAHQPSAGPLVPPLVSRCEQPPASARMPLSSEVTGLSREGALEGFKQEAEP